MTRTNFLPDTDAGLRDWGASFVAQLEAAPTVSTFGLSDEQASAFTDAFNAYSAAYTKAYDEATKGPLSTREKNTAKEAFKATARQTVAIVQAFPGTTDDMRQALQITIRDTERTPLEPPTQTPKLQVVSVDGYRVELQVLNEIDRKRRPANVSGYNLFSYVGEAPPADIASWKFEFGENKLDTELYLPTDLAVGTKVWLTVCWVNRKLETGPACQPVMTRVNYGGLSQAA
ncbi:MAG: hypothetical protein AAGJ38_02675 [Planctomycetota bacterium]